MVAEFLECMSSTIFHILHAICHGLAYSSTNWCECNNCCCDCCCGLFTKKKLTTYEIKSKEPTEANNHIIYEKDKDTSNYVVYNFPPESQQTNTNTDIIINNIEYETTATPEQERYAKYGNILNDILIYKDDVIL